MSVKEIKEAMTEGKVLFGIKQALKCSKKDCKIFVVKDARDSTISALEEKELSFGFLKKRVDVKKELDLNFDCEVFTIC